MQRHFDLEFASLKEQVLAMGAAVELAIKDALQGLQVRNDSYFDRVHETENRINRMHMAVDENCVRLLALQSPLAADLRLIVGIIKINSDLERMGDRAVNIARNGKRYISSPVILSLGQGDELPHMARVTCIMVHSALEAFFRGDIALARAVLARDDEVDELKRQIFAELVEKHMLVERESIRGAIELILIARNLERIADHATNIAEATIFAASGQDVRHGRHMPSAGASVP